MSRGLGDVYKRQVYFLQSDKSCERSGDDTGKRISGGEVHGGGSILSDGTC